MHIPIGKLRCESIRIGQEVKKFGDTAWNQATYASRWGIQAAMTRPHFADTSSWFKFLCLAGYLPENVKRDGYTAVRFTTDQQDTLAQHSYLTTLYAGLVTMYLQLQGICTEKDVVEALVMTPSHDVREGMGGDIGTPRGQKFPAMKIAARKIEELTQRDFLALFKAPNTKTHSQVCTEYERLTEAELYQTTDIAILVKIIDRLEAMFHMRWVDVTGYNENAKKVYENTVYKDVELIQNPQLKSWLKTFSEACEEADKNGHIGRHKDRRQSNHQCADLIALLDELQAAKHVKRSGWAMAGLKQFEIHTIADHGHGTTFGTWLIGEAIKERDMRWDTRAVMEFALYNELGKLFGGDVSVASNDPDDEKRKAAHTLRKCNFEAVVSGLSHEVMKTHLLERHTGVLTRDTDEARVMMIMSRFMDMLFYDFARRPKYNADLKTYTNCKIFTLVDQISDTQIRYFVGALLREWILMVEQGELRVPIHGLAAPGDRQRGVYLR